MSTSVVQVRGRPSHVTHLVVPDGIDDPARPSGGNHYDRRLISELTALGHPVREHRATDLAAELAEVPDGAVVVVDGLLGVAAPAAVAQAARRLRVVVLLHMPFAEADPSAERAERAVLAAAACVVTTSDWARAWVLRHHGLMPARVWVAAPGADPAPPATPSPDGTRLLCLAAVTTGKGHDLLVTALGEIADLDWQLTCVGALDVEPDLVAGLREHVQRSGLGDRVLFSGAAARAEVETALATTDLLVSASRHEAYGMAVTEALARAVPVVVTDVGGHRESAGAGGALVPPGDPDRLAAALRLWLTDAAERARLRTAAARRRTELRPWSTTAQRVADVLDALNPAAPSSVSPVTTRP